MKNLNTQRDSPHFSPSLRDLTTRPLEYRNEERLLLVALVIGNLIFWGSLFHAFSF